MTGRITRRTVVAAGAAASRTRATRPAFAQGEAEAALLGRVHRDRICAPRATRRSPRRSKDDFDFEPYWGNTLFKQGTELVALQRDNLELCNLAPADISKQIPAWSLMTSAYLFRDADHLKKTFKSDVGQRVHQDGARPARHPDHHARSISARATST